MANGNGHTNGKKKSEVLDDRIKEEKDNKVYVIKIEAVHVVDRFRVDFGDVESLAVSISKYGQLHPIVIDENYNLICGERRLRACQLLGLKHVEARMKRDLSELEKREIELEENLKRKDFEWQEQVNGVLELDRLKRQLHGGAVKGYGGGWGLRDTAEAVDASIASVSQDITLAEGLKLYPYLAEQPTKKAAWNKLRRLEQMKMRGLIADKTPLTKQFAKDKPIKNESCLAYIKTMGDESVNLILTDPPYAVDIGSGMVGDNWDGEMKGDKESIFKDFDLLFRECYRVLAEDAHMYVFFAVQYYDRLCKMITKAGFRVAPTPLVWNKVSPGAISGSPGSCYSNAYEPILFCVKGGKVLNKIGQSNVLEFKRVTKSDKIHMTQKPVELGRYLIEMSSEVGDVVFDPYAGSGAFVLAAFEMNRKGVGCEVDEDICKKANVYISESIKDDIKEVKDSTKPVEEEEEVKVQAVDALSTFVGLQPGSEAWIDYWKAHPDEQGAMTNYQKKMEGDNVGVEEV